MSLFTRKFVAGIFKRETNKEKETKHTLDPHSPGRGSLYMSMLQVNASCNVLFLFILPTILDLTPREY